MPDFPEVKHRIYILINEEDARALLRGEVTEDVRSMARCAVDWEWTLAKAMARPVQTTKRTKARRR